MDRRSKARLLFLAGAIATAVAATAYWTTRSGCVEAGPGMRGEVKVQADGGRLYFNGTCWTTKPTPPNDTPF
jgi:hypothetical protein